ncbi:MAG: hypothetical protein IJW82_04890 [Clostridia bacterium]|nr:hypothetical protein [Clostridia bacterium]
MLSYIVGDNRISNVFSITYAVQFIYSTLKRLFVSGANILKEKENNPNSVWNSIFWGTIFSTLIFAIPLIFVDKYIAFFGQDVEFYRIYVFYGIALLFLQTLFSFIIEKLYFEDKEKIANIHLFAFNLTTFLVLIISSFIIKNTLVSLLFTLFVLLIYIICLYIWQFEKFKIEFDFLNNFKYEASEIFSSLFLLIIYFFGYKIAFSAGTDYLNALNIVALCTDTQWDMTEAISTVAKVDISKGRFEYKKQVKNAYIYSLVLITSSIIMTLILSYFNDIVLPIVLVYLSFQIVDLLLYPIENILLTYTQLEYSSILTSALTLTMNGIRTILSLIIFSPFCTDIAQLFEGVAMFISFIIIKNLKFNVIDNKLIVKQKK